MKLKSTLLASTLACLTFTSAFTPTLFGEVLVEGFYWMLEPSGNARVGEGTVVGTQFDLENDLGYGDSEDIPGFTVVFGGVNKFGFSWMDLSVDATKELELDLQFRDLEFNVNSIVTSSMDTQLMRGFYRLGNTRGSLLGNGEIGIIYADFEASAAASGIGSTSVQADGATLYAGFNADYFLGRSLSVGGSFRFSQFDLQGFDFKYIEYEVGGKYYMNSLYVGGGYRFFGIDAKEDGNDLDIDLEFAGPVIWGGFRF